MRRLAGPAVVLVVLALAVAWWWAARAAPDSGPRGDATSPRQTVPVRPDSAFAMTVTYVYDGDTLRARAEAVNEVVTTTRPITIRIIGIDTPEVGERAQCWGDEATLLARELMPEGSRIWAAPGRDPWDDHGRRLFDVWTADGRFVPYELVAAGAAEAIRIRPNVAHADLLEQAQAAARDRGLARWTC